MGPKQLHLPVQKAQPFPGHLPQRCSRERACNMGTWADPQPRILAVQLEADVQCPHPTGLGVCLRPPYLWLLFSSIFAPRRPVDVSGFPYLRGT